MTRTCLCVIKFEILVCMGGNTPQGTKMHFPCISRAASKFNLGRSSNESMAISMLTPTAQRQKLALIFSNGKLLVFKRSTSLCHVVSVTADFNHMFYFVLST